MVVLSGSFTGRLPRALALMRRGVAPLLVISDGRDPRWPAANAYCAHRVRVPFAVLCFKPRPFSTRGEAERIGELARQRRWQTVVIVSSTYHLFRARLIVQRCFHGHLEAVAWRPPLLTVAYGVLTEWPKLIWALIVVRGC